MAFWMNQMTRIVASPDSFKARITTAEFLRMVDADVFGDAKMELVDGELERMPPPKRPHSLLQGSVFAQLVPLFGVERACVEIGIDLGNDTVFGCDVAVLNAPVSGERWPAAEEVLLAVEISLSTLARDLGMKVPCYAAAGVRNYWVVDGRTSVVYVHSLPVDGQYTEIRTIRFGEPLAVPGTDATITLT